MLLRLSELEFPTAPERLFARPGPLVLEIGFGDGRFMVDMAQSRPDWNWLGAELSGTAVLKALKRLHRHDIKQVRLYHGPASILLRTVVSARSLHRVYVNFPDPWPKRRHSDKRLLKARFFELVSTRLAKGGALFLTTDHAEYYRSAIAEARSTGLFRVERKSATTELLSTKYAMKWRGLERPVLHAVFTKTDEAAAAPPIERYPMPHAILEGNLPDPAGFLKIIHHFEGGHAVVLGVYSAVAQESLLFLAQVDEGELSQKVIVEARPHEEGVRLSLYRFGDPIVTRGVKAAVGCVADWLVECGLCIKRRAY